MATVKTIETEIECSVCGCRSLHDVITETAMGGAPDLDLRPGEPHRSSMNYWVMECPECGYCNSKLSVPAAFSRDYLDTDEYRTVCGIPTDNELARRFIKKALVCIQNENYPEAVQAYLYAAWSLDDAGDNSSAAVCRMEGARVIDEHLDSLGKTEDFLVIKADFLRRSGEFDRVISEFEGKAFSTDLLTAIAWFEVSLAARKDSAAHKVTEIPGVELKQN